MKTLVDWAKRICKPWYLNEELQHLKQSLQENGYSIREVRCAVQLRRSPRPAELVSQDTVGFAVLPYIHEVIDHIRRLLNLRGIRNIYKLTSKIQQFPRPMNDARDPLLSGGAFLIRQSVH